jgi:hypothetical protein
MEHPLSSILFLMASHLSEALQPLTFQHKIPISTIHDKEDGEVQEALMPALVRNTRGKLGMESYYSKTDRDTTSSWHKRIR